MPTVFDELRTLLGLPADTEPFALGAACLGEIKKLRNAQNVHTAEIKAWRAENRQLLADLLDAAVKRVAELDRAVGDARSATGQLYDLYRRVQTRLLGLVQLRDQNIRTIELQSVENDVLTADLDRANEQARRQHQAYVSLLSLATSRWFEIVQLRRQLARQQSVFAHYKNRVRHHLQAREAKIERMRERLKQQPAAGELARPKRRVVQLHDCNYCLVALCSDGTIWYHDHTNPSSWVEIVPPPTA